jgi:hypothetical protein
MIESKNLDPIFETQGAPGPPREGRGVESLNSDCGERASSGDGWQRRGTGPATAQTR